MDTRQVIARFEAERQALALMAHPNIAHVIDAAATETGRPYFVMELVKGIAITKYCDEKKLPLRDRLMLFLPVCQAVQHAHQKGIIHRDIKPSNVLVAEYDSHPVPKIIDFGVAKATAQKLTDLTMFTEFGQVLGTFEYMSPEQAKLNQLDIDTRSDIYALGVLLYELLTGDTPFDRHRLHRAAFDEAMRIIREEEPCKPSTRLHRTDTLPSVAANRHAEPSRLRKDVEGELDWIVMKCLEKDRKRRYQTVNSLADDLARFLKGEAVEACPPSATYRFRKLVRRHRAPLAAASLVAITLLAGVAASSWQAVRATRAERRALAERDANETLRREALASARQAKAVSDFLVNAFRSPSPLRDGRTITIAEVLDRAVSELHEKFSHDPTTEGAVLHAIGESYRALALYDQAILHLKKASQIRIRTLGRQHPDTIRCFRDLGWAYIVADRPSDALPVFKENVRITNPRLGPEHPVSLQCAYDLGHCYFNLGRREESLQLMTETLALQRSILGHDFPDTVESMFDLARNYGWAGRFDEAINLYQRVIDLAAKHPSRVVKLLEMEAKEGLALVFAELDRFDEAEALIQDSIKLFEQWLGPNSRGTRNAIESRASIYASHVNFLCNAANLKDRNPERALLLAEKAIEFDPKPSRALSNLGFARYRLGHWPASIEVLRKSCQLAPDGNGDAFQWFLLAMAHWQIDQKDEARSWFDKANEWMQFNQSDDDHLRRVHAEAAELLGIAQFALNSAASPSSNRRPNTSN
jgi:tetratricopeptide (TPR) repeat protein